MKFVFECFREIIFLVFAFIAGPLGYLLPLDEILGSGESGRIVFVHGWFAQNPLFFFLKRHLVKQGFRVYMTNFGLHLGDFYELAKKLSIFIQENDLHDVILVGTSNGAIISLLYLQKMDGWKNVRKFIGIGGPYKGTPLAYLGLFSKSVCQILPNSQFLKDLFDNGLKNPDKIVCVSAKHDEFVPIWSSQLPGAKNEILPVIGHINLAAFCKSTFSFVAKYARSR